jgi:hypothetical protein
MIVTDPAERLIFSSPYVKRISEAMISSAISCFPMKETSLKYAVYDMKNIEERNARLLSTILRYARYKTTGTNANVRGYIVLKRAVPSMASNDCAIAGKIVTLRAVS